MQTVRMLCFALQAENSTAFNISKLKGGPRGAKGRPGAAPVVKKPDVKEKKEEPVKKGKVCWTWAGWGGEGRDG